MTTVIAIILFLVFLFLASMHIYWALGGRWGRDAAVPAKDNNAKLFTPGPLPTLIVASGLLLLGFIVLVSGKLIAVPLPAWINHSALWIIAAIFLLRAIGDFKYVGFFKKITKTRFAQNDTKYYSPLCIVIGILAIVLALYK
jgi:hypothetical protein